MNASPYYSDESVTLYHGEALAVLASLPTGSVDAVVADPPYSSGGMMRGDRAQATVAKYVTSRNTRRDELLNFSGDSRDQRSYAYWSALWLSEARRVTAPGWTAHAWSTAGGYGGGRGGKGDENRHRERIYFSPACVDLTVPDLFTTGEIA